ncbi:PspA/IM30 family protein [Clostridium sp. NSJ-49]|uniref:Phage shock protein A, PspA n=1 Tax=Clostridium disporicum TaxID=84024 RepID=A0A174BFV2_9CLOT|nr:MULTISPECIES: PspA/IM30 family protein [Clostridium]MBC5627201.1 PspA/IM30 family protein [Clostridium sp. NSJ-49]MCD2500775.1 PspA/IM30 family protein [Clostridium sp. NSJ-145]MDU6341524.1 PspA/IM30 family protein [Clostridium sp.]CUN99911.1 phage shock protein A%2C PspA [Clostridium disporicum]
MSILKRFTDIMSSNINAMLDKCEDPVKMVDQLMRNLNKDLNEIKVETASVMAEENRAKRELDECQEQVNKMLDYAKRAVAAGNDDDARRFLDKKVTLSEKLTLLQTKYDSAKANSEKMRSMYNKVSNQIEELNERRAVIKAKMTTAKIQEKVNTLGNSVNKSTANMDSFARMEEKANRMLDEANAMAELNSKPVDDIDDLMSKYNSNNSAVEDELAALKGNNDAVEDMLRELKGE